VERGVIFSLFERGLEESLKRAGEGDFFFCFKEVFSWVTWGWVKAFQNMLNYQQNKRNLLEGQLEKNIVCNSFSRSI
jgi:hypothetical protein